MEASRSLDFLGNKPCFIKLASFNIDTYKKYISLSCHFGVLGTQPNTITRQHGRLSLILSDALVGGDHSLFSRWRDRDCVSTPVSGDATLATTRAPAPDTFHAPGPGRVSGCESQSGVGARNCTIMIQCQGPGDDMTLLWHRAKDAKNDFDCPCFMYRPW